jgi:UDP-hydrolysing UDP-N-acetyl-D-glucosamine 2-epimerase
LPEHGRARRRVCVVLVDRANYGRLKPVMHAIRECPALELSVAAAGSMLLDRFDRPVEQVKSDGFDVAAEIHMELEGSTPATMAKSVGFGVIEFSSEFQRSRPDFVVIIGDRYEALAAAIAAAFMNLTIVHLQGGEVSGSIDESTRHAISKLAHYHFPATVLAAENLVRMGERRETILGIGCPSSDLARTLDRRLRPEMFNRKGAGVQIDPSAPYLLAVLHPTTTEFGGERRQMENLLLALEELRIQTLLLWPNIDAGADRISKAIRVFRSLHEQPWLRTTTNLAPDVYLAILAGAACAVGNSSSFVRDSSYFGTPIVLVGNRQSGREVADNAIGVDASPLQIKEAVKLQIKHGPYSASQLYGDGRVAERVARALVRIRPYSQKQLHFEDARDDATARANR